MTLYLIIILVFTILLGGSGVWALYWAVKNGQMTSLENGAKSIFNDDEPLGQMSDCFPGEPKRKNVGIIKG
ncbi:MAG: cbb3-type cytochrome oxidase assembly protein CcoS [Verrucomicrobiota bacterium]|nr:cbb3-type cytochrome oxidase assembly protein CcoS [Verrucomicrobiota bacterium]